MTSANIDPVEVSSAVAIIPTNTTLPMLVDRAVSALANARTAAEVLEARDLASIAYDAAKKAARLGQAKQAHDDLVAAAYRAQADALAIESEAKRRLANEYDAAQERGEVAGRRGGGERSGKERSLPTPTAANVGLTRKEIHEARKIRDAEEADPGIVRRTVDEAVAAGEEPTKAKVRRAVSKAERDAAAREAERERLRAQELAAIQARIRAEETESKKASSPRARLADAVSSGRLIDAKTDALAARMAQKAVDSSKSSDQALDFLEAFSLHLMRLAKARWP